MPADARAGERVSLADLVRPLRDPGFRRAVLAASVLAAATISDAFVYLVLLERLGFAVGLFPLLYVGTSLSYLTLAVPAGVLADRWGRWQVFLLGYGALLAVYVLLLSRAAGPAAVFAAVALLGAYYAGTDGVVVAFASSVVTPAQRGAGLAALTTSTSMARVLASVVFGWLWTAAGREGAVAAFVMALGVALAAAALSLAPLAARYDKARRDG
jgi:MFS family permease